MSRGDEVDFRPIQRRSQLPPVQVGAAYRRAELELRRQGSLHAAGRMDVLTQILDHRNRVGSLHKKAESGRCRNHQFAAVVS